MGLIFTQALSGCQEMLTKSKEYIESVIQKALDICVTYTPMFPVRAGVDVIEVLCESLDKSEATTLEEVFSDLHTFDISYTCFGYVSFEISKPNRNNDELVKLINDCLINNGFKLDEDAVREDVNIYTINIKERSE